MADRGFIQATSPRKLATKRAGSRWDFDLIGYKRKR
jgi:hypothetical protein